MSRTKAVDGPGGRLLWVWDNAHDVVVADMVKQSVGLASFDEDRVHDWRVCASVGDLAIALDPKSSVELSDLLALLTRVRETVAARGDVERADLVGWSVLDGVDVSGGFLRTDRLEVACLLDVVDAFEGVLSGDLADPPEGGWWLVGAPGGRDILRPKPSHSFAADHARSGGEQFRFIVREAFTITGRGTVVMGFVDAGRIHVGDDLALVHDDTARIVRCRGVEMVNRKPYRSPPDLGLLIPELAPTDVRAGDVLRSAQPPELPTLNET